MVAKQWRTPPRQDVAGCRNGAAGGRVSSGHAGGRSRAARRPSRARPRRRSSPPRAGRHSASVSPGRPYPPPWPPRASGAGARTARRRHRRSARPRRWPASRGRASGLWCSSMRLTAASRLSRTKGAASTPERSVSSSTPLGRATRSPAALRPAPGLPHDTRPRAPPARACGGGRLGPRRRPRRARARAGRHQKRTPYTSLRLRPISGARSLM